MCEKNYLTCNNSECERTINHPQTDCKCPECGGDMGEWTWVGHSGQFSLDDKRPEREPRYSNKGVRIENPVTFHMRTMLEWLCGGIGDYSIHPDDVVTIELKTVDDGMKVIYMVEGRMVIEKRNEQEN